LIIATFLRRLHDTRSKPLSRLNRGLYG